MKEELMEDWQVLEMAIPRGLSETVARSLHLSADYVRRWRQEPLSDDPRRFVSPVGRVNELVDVMFLKHRPGASLIVNHVNAHYHHLIDQNPTVLTLNSTVELNNAGSQLLQESGRAVESLMAHGVTRETVFRLIMLKQKVDEVLACANQDLIRSEETAARNRNSVVREITSRENVPA